MSKLYFFKSSIDGDNISGVSVFSKSFNRAYNLACKCFAKNNCKGLPMILAI